MNTFQKTKCRNLVHLSNNVLIEVTHDEAMTMLKLIDNQWPVLLIDHPDVLEQVLRNHDHFELLTMAKTAVKLLLCVDRPGSAVCDAWDDRLKLANKLIEKWNAGLTDHPDV